MWAIFAVLAGVFATIESLMNRYILRGERDEWAYSFFFSAVGTVISLPFMAANPKLPHRVEPWLLALSVGAIIVLHNLLIFRASGRIEASMLGALLKLRLVWVFIMGVVFLGEPFSWLELAGTVLVVCAGVIIFHFKRSSSPEALLLMLVVTVLSATIVILTKYLIGPFNVPSVTFFASFLPAAVLNFVVMPNATSRISTMWKEGYVRVIAACAAGSFFNLALNKALSLQSPSAVLAINEAFLVAVLVGEHILLKEREGVRTKILSVSLAVLGAVLVQASL